MRRGIELRRIVQQCIEDDELFEMVRPSSRLCLPVCCVCGAGGGHYIARARVCDGGAPPPLPLPLCVFIEWSLWVSRLGMVNSWACWLCKCYKLYKA